MDHCGIGSLLIVVSAPSGAGKTTLCQHVLAANRGITRAVTCTTRAPRIDERDGVDYYFLETSMFLARLQAGEFLEHATVHGHLYGVLKSEVHGRLCSGNDLLLNVDVQGAASVRRCAQADAALKRALVTVFLTPCSRSVLEGRLRNRGTESTEVSERRLLAASQEVAHWPAFDYLLISGTVQEDLRRMQVIIEAERLRSIRTRLDWED